MSRDVLEASFFFLALALRYFFIARLGTGMNDIEVRDFGSHLSYVCVFVWIELHDAQLGSE